LAWPFTKKDSEKPLEDRVCIPEGRRIINEKEAQKRILEDEKKAKQQQMLKELTKKEFPTFTDNKPRFFIEGVFAVSGTLMLKGTVVSGKITKTSKLKIRKKAFKVRDIQLGGRSVGSIGTGQKGAVFFDKAKGLYLRTEEIVNLV